MCVPHDLAREATHFGLRATQAVPRAVGARDPGRWIALGVASLQGLVAVACSSDATSLQPSSTEPALQPSNATPVTPSPSSSPGESSPSVAGGLPGAVTQGESAAAPSWDESDDAGRRARDVLSEMTIDEKVDLLHGEVNFFYGFYNAPIERVGIPALTMADGPAGVRIANPDVNGQRATQLPSPMALAATWSLDLARRYGALAGAEAYATGHNVLLSPAIDIARVAQAGRAFETYGEDPLLSGALAAVVIRAIQSNPVVADIKHYRAYNQETNRLTGGNAIIDERALQEIYLRGFAIAVRDGHPGSAMCSFNKLNGEYACENGELLNVILKTQMGFTGWVMTDYGANHSTAKALIAGLDQDMPGNGTPAVGPGTCLFCGPLLDAVDSGEVPVARVDDAALRILRPMFGLGLFDNPVLVGPLPESEHGAEARAIAERSMVLLQNRGALPLDASISSIVVIGADADSVVAGGGSSLVKPTYGVSPLDAIERAPERASACNTSREAFQSLRSPCFPVQLLCRRTFLAASDGDGEGGGLRAEYFLTPDFSGAPLLDRMDPYAGINGGFLIYSGFNVASPHFPPQPQELNTNGSIRWTGIFTAPVAGSYQLALTSTGTSRLFWTTC